MFITLGILPLKTLAILKIISVNPLYLIIDKINGNTEESNGNKYSTLVSTEKNKSTLKAP